MALLCLFHLLCVLLVVLSMVVCILSGLATVLLPPLRRHVLALPTPPRCYPLSQLIKLCLSLGYSELLCSLNMQVTASRLVTWAEL